MRESGKEGVREREREKERVWKEYKKKTSMSLPDSVVM